MHIILSLFRKASLFTLIAPLLAGAALAGQGGAMSGGGDLYASEFVRIGQELCEMFRRSPVEGVQAESFCAATKNTRVNTRDRLRLKGVEVDAINTPAKKRILLNRTRWLKSVNTPRDRFVLVAHEYFGIMRLKDENYQISRKIFSTPGHPLLTYRCELIAAPQFGTRIDLEAHVYRDFIDVRFFDEKGHALADPVESFWSFQVTEVTEKPFAVTQSAVITTNLKLFTRILELPYSEEIAPGEGRRNLVVPILDITTLNAQTLVKSEVSCTVRRAGI